MDGPIKRNTDDETKTDAHDQTMMDTDCRTKMNEDDQTMRNTDDQTMTTVDDQDEISTDDQTMTNVDDQDEISTDDQTMTNVDDQTKMPMDDQNKMNEVDQTKRHINDQIKTRVDDQTKTEESHFCRLFNEVLDSIRKKNFVSDKDIEEAIKKIILSFKKKPPVNTGGNLDDPEINLGEMANMFAYIYRYGPHGAGLARHRLLEGLKKCEKFKNHLKELAGKKINVLSLGGGPGNDITGFCSALHECFELREWRINFVVADKIGQFADCLHTMESLLREKDFGNASKMFGHGLSTSFICVDLLGDKEEDKKYFDVLAEADIIIMAKFVDILRTDKQKPFLEKIMPEVKLGAMLLFIGFPPYEESEFMPYFENQLGLEVLHFDPYETPAYIFTGNETRRFGHGVSGKSKCKLLVARKKILSRKTGNI